MKVNVYSGITTNADSFGSRKFNLEIENLAGTFRSGKNSEGEEWKTRLTADYGFIRDIKSGGDKEGLDVFVNLSSRDTTYSNVYVVFQNNGHGDFDEHKVMLGYPSAESAKEGYLSNYDTSEYFTSIAACPLNSFLDYIDNNDVFPFRSSEELTEHFGGTS